MDEESKELLAKIAGTIRQLSIEAVQKANSGHPGLPLGCAELGAYLYGYLLKYNPENTKWLNRDRFILSAGHGSMLLYSCLYLAKLGLTIEDIQNFRQLHSKTPGHPEYGMTEGVEATTGPLGQGIANAVGQALGLKILSDKFNGEEFPVFTNKVYALAGDGCIMEGVAAEASSLAGHLALDNLVLIYDANGVTLDGMLPECSSEDTKLRYEAYGWKVYEIDGHSFDEIDGVFSEIKKEQDAPCLVIAHTIIGKGSPNKAGTHGVHGSPLGMEELIATKEALGLPEEEFYVPQPVEDFFNKKLAKGVSLEKAWKDKLRKWGEMHPDLYREFNQMIDKHLPENLEEELLAIAMKTPIAGRAASEQVLHRLGTLLPQLYGGSADLSGSDKTMMKEFSIISPSHFEGRNIKYGVREFAMGAIATGLAQTDMITPYVGTFFTFSDYMRNAIRLAALSHVQVIYQFTHDSVFLGEDGPTHQPVEHLSALRAMPNVRVIRPADSGEVKMAWLAALRYRGPTAIVLSRQSLPLLEECAVSFEEGVGRGAYIVRKESGTADFTLLATGSELSLALDVATALEKLGKKLRVVSMPCWEIFEQQDEEYQKEILGGDIGIRVSIEAGSSFGWHKWIGMSGIAISIDQYGASAPAGCLAEEFGFTVDAIVGRLLQ